MKLRDLLRMAGTLILLLLTNLVWESFGFSAISYAETLQLTLAIVIIMAIRERSDEAK